MVGMATVNTKTFDPSRLWTASWSFIQRFRIWATNLLALESFFAPPFWSFQRNYFVPVRWLMNIQASTIPIEVVSSVDLARYFPWSIGIKYIGFSNLKTFDALPTNANDMSRNAYDMFVLYANFLNMCNQVSYARPWRWLLIQDFRAAKRSWSNFKICSLLSARVLSFWGVITL